MQRTPAGRASVQGVGVHTGRPARLTLAPAPIDSGVVFVREDLPGRPEIKVGPESARIEESRRMTVLQAPGRDGGEPARVGMVEHLLAALAGLGVDNAIVTLDGFECPIFDGSATPYVELIRRAGIVEQEATAPCLTLLRPLVISGERGEIVALPAERTRLTFFAEFAEHGLADEWATFDASADDFALEVAPARTFIFWPEVEALRKAGMIRGGSLDCAVVLRDGKPVQGGFRLQNELARHKLLDLMGDLAVLGRPLAALISARASGHALNQEFVRRVAKESIHA
jgi:UDP-3-O-acyl N-acetylglucosamine deacetylase